MYARTSLCKFARRSVLVAVLLAGSPLPTDPVANAQVAAVEFAKLEPKLKARSAKSEKSDLAPIESFYRDFLRPNLTQPSPETINQTRKEFMEDANNVVANPSLVRAYNDSVIGLMGELIRPKDKVVFHPNTRISALVILGNLNSEVSKDGATKKPDAAVQTVLASLIDPTEIDALSCLSMRILSRHLAQKVVAENAKKAFVGKLKSFLEAPVPPNRTSEANKYLIGQAIECLTLIAITDTDKEASKLACEFLTPLLVQRFESESSEWLMETVCLSLGQITPVNLSEEDLVKIEYGLAKYARQSLKDWKKRISNSGAAGMGMMGGYGMGSDGAGSMEGGSGDGFGYPGGMGMKDQPKKNPYDLQPKEVKNARRIAHQRFEAIHLALNGTYRKPVEAKPTDGSPLKPAPVAEVNGLLKLMPESPKKDNIRKLTEKVEAFQTELNDEKVKDLSTLFTAVGKSMKGLREICVEIMGEDPTVITDEDASKIFSAQN
jgi:hypothetical protein